LRNVERNDGHEEAPQNLCQKCLSDLMVTASVI
jgi:hypothetical protein